MTKRHTTIESYSVVRWRRGSGAFDSPAIIGRAVQDDIRQAWNKQVGTDRRVAIEGDVLTQHLPYRSFQSASIEYRRMIAQRRCGDRESGGVACDASGGV